MVQTLRMLESNLDNEGDDKPNTIKQAIRRPDWPKREKLCRLNMTLSLKMRPGNSQLCRKIDKGLLVDDVLS